MTSWEWLTKARRAPGRGAAAIVVTLLGVASPGPAGADGGNAGLVHACVNRWTQVRIVGPNDACDPGERSLHWVLAGPDAVTSQGGGAACPAGTMACGGAGCVNVATDVRNCGACGRICVFGQSCVAGTCR